MKTRLVALLLLVAAPVYAAPGIAVGVGCFNACGQEVVAPGGAADCAVVVTNPSPAFDLLVVEAVRVDVDGNQATLSGTPVTISPGDEATFPFRLMTDTPVGGTITVQSDVQGEVLFNGTSSSGLVDFGGSGTVVTVVADPMCDATTTTTVTTTTATTRPPVTTTTQPPPDRHVPNGRAFGWHRKFGH